MRKFLTIDRWSLFHFSLLFIILIAAVMYSDSNHIWRLQFQHFVFDSFNKMHPRERSGDVVIVDIDEKSLAQHGQWPWSRDILADLTIRLSNMGVKSIVYDGVFAEEDRTSPKRFIEYLEEKQNLKVEEIFPENIPDFDEAFAKAIKESGVVVTGFTYGNLDRAVHEPLDKRRLLMRPDTKETFLQNAPYFKGAAVNLSIFSKAAAGNGSFMARPDFDGVMRRTGMVFSDGKTLYPSLSLEAIRVAVLGRKGTIQLANTPLDKKKEIDTNYRIVLGDYIIPVEDDGKIYVYYRHFCSEQDATDKINYCVTHDYISALHILDDQFREKVEPLIKGKIVLIGTSAEGLKDLRNTAIAAYRPGVEVHANVIEQVLQDKYLKRPDITRHVEAFFIFAVGLFFITIAQFIGVLLSLVLCCTLISMAIFGAYLVYVDYGLLVDPAYPSLSVLGIFIVSTILSYIHAEHKRKRIRNAFGMYVAKDVIRDLERNPEHLKLGGENRELTVMFTDIRKFTSISEGMSPEELINVMNKFLTGMTDIVMRHEGTVDKYIGDAMMAFWNAPRDVENHAQKACRAALLMQGALNQINEVIYENGDNSDRKSPILLKAGIGINTGICAVGNMGSRQRFAYSALGDPVNLASRLEGLTKTYHTDILISKSTYEQTQDFAVLGVDLVRVTGKREPVEIYALLGDGERAEKSEFIELKKVHGEFMSLYRKAEFKKALRLLEKESLFKMQELAMMYEMYQMRLQNFIEKGTPDGWDGVYFSDKK
ncbi:MAG: adenylate/guanylate cyclase domain-containing protein [Alphaproteobacteria bacterium]|nr:adenylate/guanylate cyclase domain-containing protein [Alphaproteobacteria bacterium]